MANNFSPLRKHDDFLLVYFFGATVFTQLEIQCLMDAGLVIVDPYPHLATCNFSRPHPFFYTRSLGQAIISLLN